MQTRQNVSALEHFSELPDPRQHAKIIYPLREIVLTSLCAILCGADSYVEIEEFGKAKIEFLRRFCAFENGIPSHDTFGIVFSNIDSKKFNELFISWVKSLQESIPELVAIDGKTVRRSMDNETKPIHIVSAWASSQSLVIGQVKTDEKSNEIPAISELLSMLVLKGAIVTIDAMGCQKSIIKEILSKEADYLISVKGNQPTLHADIRTIFEAAKSQTIPVTIQEHKTVDSDHGRIETRIYSVIDKVEWLSTKEQWPGVKSIGSVISVREQAGKTTEETRYFISSLPADVQKFAEAVRSHWTIENSLHWVMDIVFRDDECRVRKRHGPANLVTLKHITHNMLKSLPGKMSMRVRRKRAGWDDGFLADALGALPE